MENIIQVDRFCHLLYRELNFSAIRAQGAGGQHVNKVSTAIHLRFDVSASSLPAKTKENILKLADQRMTNDGVIVIKAQNSRSQEQNKLDAIDKLVALIKKANKVTKVRRATKPTKASVKRRLESKNNRKQLKQQRQKSKNIRGLDEQSSNGCIA